VALRRTTWRPGALRPPAAIYRIACGRLAEQWVVTDYLTMLRQLGIVTDEELATAGTPTVATPAPWRPSRPTDVTQMAGI
jgi:hypothetical protein